MAASRLTQAAAVELRRMAEQTSRNVSPASGGSFRGRRPVTSAMIDLTALWVGAPRFRRRSAATVRVEGR